MIAQNITQLQQKIKTAANRAGRSAEEITLIGITKTVDVERILQAYDAGLRNFGENRVQELRLKIGQVDMPCCWHLVGHLQTNKVKDVIGQVALIHSLDSVRLADEIEKRAINAGLTVDALVQINIADDDAKFGLSTAEALPFLEKMLGYEAIRIRGLMTIGPYVADECAIRAVFAELRQLFEHAKTTFSGTPNVTMDYLSMGMSGDFTWAIAEGSNMIRVGSAIFGSR